MEHTYKQLTHYDVRKSVFVHSTPLSPLAQQFIDKEGGLKSLYLQLRSFFTGNVPHDIHMYQGEFDSHAYFDHDQLDLWLTFESGHGLYYYFKAEYVNYKDSIHFDKISHHDHEFAKEHCMRIDPERYRNVAFGNKLYDLLGQQFTADLLPRLHNLSVTITGGLPSPVRMLSRLLTLLIPLGIIIPFLVSLQLLPVWCTVLSISGTIALLIHLMLTLHQTLSGEIKM